VELIGGVDVSFSGKFENGACAGLLIYSVKRKKIIYEDYEYVKLTE
jgi:deoxyinosine 3'endonuclease (endonuclease V)